MLKVNGIVMITGASSGIGAATALKYAQNNFDLILLSRRKEQLEAVAKNILESYPIRVLTLQADVRDYDTCHTILNNIDDSWKAIDILVNNAGLAKGFAPIHEGNIDHWDTMIDTNIKGLLHITRIVSPWMVQRKNGFIINLGSIAGKEVYPNGNVYCASKYGVDALTEAMRIDLLQHGIRVGQICPGHVEQTEFAKVRFDGDNQKARIYDDFIPLNASDIADIIFFMTSQPPHVNIRDIVVTGKQQASANIIHRSGRAL